MLSKYANIPGKAIIDKELHLTCVVLDDYVHNYNPLTLQLVVVFTSKRENPKIPSLDMMAV